MNIQELGSLGEFVGAIAVMVTLVYLAIQTRLTRKAAEETAKFASMQMLQGVADMYSRWRLARMNPEIAELLVKSRGSERLTDAEQLIYSAAFEELFFTVLVSYQSAAESAFFFHEESVDIIYLLDTFKANPKAIAEWQRMRPALIAGSSIAGSSKFVETIDKMLKEQGIANHDLANQDNE
jgi:hypothetical protein